MADPLQPVADLRTGPETLLRRVRHAVSDRRFLVKSVAPAADPSAVERIAARLRREYDFAVAVAGDRFLKPLDWDAAGVALTYEDAQGTLAQLVRQEGRLEPPLVARVLYQCLEALEQLHRLGFGHGALTAEGVFVTPDGDVALGDFVGYRFGPRERGVPVRPEYPVWYRAPELIDIALEDGVPDKARANGCPPAVRADLYSLGYLALQLLRPEVEFLRLFGVDPTAGAADANWDGWHGDLSRPAPKLDDVLYDVPVGLREVLQPLVLKSPADRARLTVHEVRDAIDRLGLMSGKKLPAIGRKVPPPPPLVPDDSPPPRPRGDPKKYDRIILQLTAADGTSRVFPSSQTVVVGSGKGADVLLRHDTVAPRHAIFVHRGASGWWAYDTRSNALGTQVNGASAAAGAAVRSNWAVTFGRVGMTATVHRGFRFGPFLVAARLHEGQNGVVYRAVWCEKNNAEVAVRVFPLTFQADTDAIRRFLRSIPEAGQFRHPNIVSLYQGGFRRSRERGRLWYLVMKYMPGGSFRDRLRGGRMPLPAILRAGREVAAAVAAIAARGMVHRSINPSCILFDGAMTARLGDFLLCRREELATFHKVTRAGDTLLGDYAYQSPEQLRGGDAVTWQSDQYSLAACLYEAATGQPVVATAGRGLPQILSAALDDPVPSARSVNPAVPPALDDLLRRALAKDPADRYDTPEGFRDALADIKA